jgi:hypothetical protein
MMNVVNGVLVPASAEDARLHAEQNARIAELIASDPVKYANYSWQSR